MAIGDSFGAAFEFIKPQRAKAVGLVNDTETYQAHFPSISHFGA